MSERHDRSVRAAAMTLLGYIKEIRSLMASNDEFHSTLKSRLTSEESEEIEVILSGMEHAIEDYWSGSSLQQEEKDIKWRIYVLGQFMEDLVYDMRPERLSKTHGSIDSDKKAEKMAELCERLDGQIRRLKNMSSK